MRLRDWRGAGPVALAVFASLVCYAAGWRGTDWAAQIYRSSLVAQHGLVLWSPGWYGGIFPLNYSVLFPLAGAFLGLWPVAVASAGGAALCFDRLMCLAHIAPGSASSPRRYVGAASAYFAASTVIEVAIGQLPVLMGEALALGSILCFATVCEGLRPEPRTGRTPVREAAALLAGAVLALGAALTSPLVGAFLALSLCAWGLGEVVTAPRKWGSAVAGVSAAAATAVAAAVPPVVFPVPGSFPFPFGDLVVILLLCIFCTGPWAPKTVRIGALLYAGASIMLFIVPNQVGDNGARFGAYIGVPLALVLLPQARARATRASVKWATATTAAAIAGGLVVWHWSPIAEAFSGAPDGRSSTTAFFYPLTNELRALSHDRPVRVEVVPLAHHWESAYVAGSISIARGWERQLDISYAELFYKMPLRPQEYITWLDDNGASYVALAQAPLDYAGTEEAALLRSGAVGRLSLLWRSPDWTLWKVEASPGLATAPGKVTSLRPDGLTVDFSTAGTSIVRVRWSPYWSVNQAMAGHTCVQRAPGGWTEVLARRAALVKLSVSVLHPRHGACGGASPAAPLPQPKGAESPTIGSERLMSHG